MVVAIRCGVLLMQGVLETRRYPLILAVFSGEAVCSTGAKHIVLVRLNAELGNMLQTNCVYAIGQVGYCVRIKIRR